MGRANAGPRRPTLGLSKGRIRRIVIEKMRVVYHDWHFEDVPFADFLSQPGERREDSRAFIIALMAALLGGISEAMEQNNEALAAALARRPRGQPPAVPGPRRGINGR